MNINLTAETIRSRSIRELILRLCYNTHRANPDISVLARHIYEGFSTGRIQYLREDIDPEISALVEAGMIAVVNVPNVGMPEKGYRITNRGGDFFRAGCPWAKIDEFTGEARLM
jgi:hypothetical protein